MSEKEKCRRNSDRQEEKKWMNRDELNRVGIEIELNNRYMRATPDPMYQDLCVYRSSLDGLYRVQLLAVILSLGMFMAAASAVCSALLRAVG